MKTKEEKAAYQRQWSSKNRDKANAIRKRWIKANPEKHQAYRIKQAREAANEARRRKFGSDGWDVFSNQKGLCAVCDSQIVAHSKGVNGAQLDHDHNTGKIRGWLCRHCNLAIGLFKDNPDTMDRAARYVRKDR